MSTKNALEYLSQFADSLPAGTAVGQYLNHLADEIALNRSQEDFVSRWQPILERHRAQWNSRFASVVMRTQGRRPEALREALLCLYAQDDRDFEVILIGHKLDETQRRLVDDILEEQDPSFRAQIRFLMLNEGNRTTPLNFGFAHALGEYIMIFDDDDLVMEDWISAFHARARECPGAMLYRYTIAQQWRVVDTAFGLRALRACGSPDAKYCHDYDPFDEVYMNACPPIGLAFPAVAFRELGVTFDETLATTEDWDFLLRVAKYCGSASIAATGAVYRLWTNAESSATVHAQDEWAENYQLIGDKLNCAPLLLPAGSALRLRNLIKDAAIAHEIVNSRIWRASKPYRTFMIWLKPQIRPILRWGRRKLRRWRESLCSSVLKIVKGITNA